MCVKGVYASLIKNDWGGGWDDLPSLEGKGRLPGGNQVARPLSQAVLTVRSLSLSLGNPPITKVPEVDSSCRLLIVPLFRGSSRFESLILSHHSRFNVTCECNKEEINDDE